MQAPFAVIEAGPAEALLFRRPVAMLTAHMWDEVDATLARLEAARHEGLHAVGYAAYEAGYGFEPRLRPLAPSGSGPLLCFGLFHDPEPLRWADVIGQDALEAPVPAWTESDYAERFKIAIEHIRAGDAYQVNLTFPLNGRWYGDPLALYATLRHRQPAPYGAMLCFGDEAILSLSPELFFSTQGETIRTRPMKGTAPRGRNGREDAAAAQALRDGEKTRAENLMIVDLLRNDLARVAYTGSVAVTDLFTVERHPTVLQMTSGIEARLRPGVGLPGLFGSLFPCGSVTGAPKIKAMEIIRALEDRPRGVYCGTIGHVRPNGDARFSVAIRTAVLAPDGRFVFNVGSGVVFDSDMAAEYEECLLKARFLDRAMRSSGSSRPFAGRPVKDTLC